MTLGEWLRVASGLLRDAGIEGAGLEAQMLAAHALGRERSWVLAHPEAVIPDGAEDLLARRVAREPLAYILGWREFYGRRFFVSPSVLIPRQETELLVEVALSRAGEGARVLDVGTGSGCIGVTLKLERPDLVVTAVDISAPALQVALSNALALAAEIAFVESDLFSALTGHSFDLIVSNPPYVGESVVLMPEVGLHEPGTALFAGIDGLDVYSRLAREAGDYLTSGGALMLELGAGQSSAVCSLFGAEGWELEGLHKDLAGHDRVAVFSLS